MTGSVRKIFVIARMRKPLIIILIVGYTIGGAEKLIFELCKALRNDFEFIVVALKGQGPFRSLLNGEGIKTFSLGGVSSLDLRVFLRLNALIRKLKPDLINSHLWRANFVGRVIGRLNKIPVISTVHTTGTGLKQIQVLMERFTSPLATVNVCCSKYVCIIHSGKIKYPFKYYIYNGVRITEKPLPSLIDPYKILTLSRINVNEKAIIELVKAVSILKKSGRYFTVDIYGEGEDTDIVLQQIKKSGVEKLVQLKGFTSNPQEIISGYSVFILSSKFEGLPFSILEAIEAGLVVVASNVGGIPEIIEDGKTGFLIDGYSPESIAEGFNRLLDNRNELPQIIINARDKLEKMFNLEKTILHWKNLYNFILEHNSAEGLCDLIPHV
jgi:glycosyltransferase involved in cell wall biosynthesis